MVVNQNHDRSSFHEKILSIKPGSLSAEFHELKRQNKQVLWLCMSSAYRFDVTIILYIKYINTLHNINI